MGFALWCTTFRSSPPPAFTKDLIARFLCRHIREQALGGLDPETTRHLASRARERHTVTVVANGFVWREATYASLSTTGHHRYELEWTTLLWPPDRREDDRFAGRGRCAARGTQRATSCSNGRH
jgi:hypothetical protein